MKEWLCKGTGIGGGRLRHLHKSKEDFNKCWFQISLRKTKLAFQQNDLLIKLRDQLKNSSDLLDSKYGGHCYVASEAAYHLLGGKNAGFTPMFLYHEGKPHWFLKQDKRIIDLTADQFKTKPDYSLAKGKGFLTKKPCRRTKILITRLRSDTNSRNTKSSNA